MAIFLSELSKHVKGVNSGIQYKFIASDQAYSGASMTAGQLCIIAQLNVSFQIVYLTWEAIIENI